MGRKIVAVNAGPRKGWNTETLITQASKGAEEAGADVQRFDLFRLENIRDAFPASAARRRDSKVTASAGTA